MCVKDSNSIEIDSDVSVEIPSGTVIAYSILELEVKKDGQYCECVWVRVCVVNHMCGYERENDNITLTFWCDLTDNQITEKTAAACGKGFKWIS